MKNAQRKSAKKRSAKTVNLALQGGGAHGAFAWGVLDRLLEEEHLSFEGISACSAGAMNGVVMASGLSSGGRDGAKKALADFWRRVSQSALFSPLQPSPLDRMMENYSLENSPTYAMLDIMSRLFSPYQFNPLNINPLMAILTETVDFERLHRDCPVKLFFSATNVRTGKVKIFKNQDVTADAVMASACLPFLFQAVEIEGEHYWDGGYMGNPALYPLIYNCKSPDIVVVHINPLNRDEEPKTAHDILNRINEISFNSSLMREMRAIAFVTKLIDEGEVKAHKLKRLLIHAIEADAFMQELTVSSKLNPDWDFLCHLHDVGRTTAEAWLADTYEQLNDKSSIDISERYL
ncbi:MAG: patatin-like phospholipase family protein [Pseudomonadota bacterium]